MSWTDGQCDRCGRSTRVVPVDGHGQLGIVCLDMVAEEGDNAAQEVLR